MKKLILLLLFSVKINAQQVVKTYSVGQPASDAKWDTVRTAFLITDWDDDFVPHNAYVVNGWAARTQDTYFGEPQSSWTIRALLDYHKKPFGSGVIIWQYKVNYERKYDSKK